MRSDSEFPWQVSSVSVLALRIRSAERPVSVPEAEWERALTELPAKGKWGVLLALDRDMRGSATDGRGNSAPVLYSDKEGLLVGEECGEL